MTRAAQAASVVHVVQPFALLAFCVGTRSAVRATRDRWRLDPRPRHRAGG